MRRKEKRQEEKKEKKSESNNNINNNSSGSDTSSDDDSDDNSDDDDDEENDSQFPNSDAESEDLSERRKELVEEESKYRKGEQEKVIVKNQEQIKESIQAINEEHIHSVTALISQQQQQGYLQIVFQQMANGELPVSIYRHLLFNPYDFKQISELVLQFISKNEKNQQTQNIIDNYLKISQYLHQLDDSLPYFKQLGELKFYDLMFLLLRDQEVAKANQQGILYFILQFKKIAKKVVVRKVEQIAVENEIVVFPEEYFQNWMQFTFQIINKHNSIEQLDNLLSLTTPQHFFPKYINQFTKFLNTIFLGKVLNVVQIYTERFVNTQGNEKTNIKQEFQDIMHTLLHKKFQGEFKFKEYFKLWCGNLEYLIKKIDGVHLNQQELQQLQDMIEEEPELLQNFSSIITILSFVEDNYESEISQIIQQQYDNDPFEEAIGYFFWPFKTFLIIYSWIKNDLVKNQEKEEEKLQLSKQKSMQSQLVFPLKKVNSQEGSVMSLDSAFIKIREKLHLLTQVFLTLQLESNKQSVQPFKILVQNYMNLQNVGLDARLHYLRCEAVKRANKFSDKFDDNFEDTFEREKKNYFHSIFNALNKHKWYEIVLKQFDITFKKEQGETTIYLQQLIIGIDQGGLTREFLMCLSKEIFDPQFGLFCLSANKLCIYPSPAAKYIPNNEQIFHFLGQLLGKILIDNLVMQVNFSKPFLKQLFSIQLSDLDLEDIDQELAKNLIWILNNPIGQEDALGLKFVYEQDILGIKKSIPLINGGENIYVNDDNKKEYVKVKFNNNKY